MQHLVGVQNYRVSMVATTKPCFHSLSPPQQRQPGVTCHPPHLVLLGDLDDRCEVGDLALHAVDALHHHQDLLPGPPGSWHAHRHGLAQNLPTVQFTGTVWGTVCCCCCDCCSCCDRFSCTLSHRGLDWTVPISAHYLLTHQFKYRSDPYGTRPPSVVPRSPHHQHNTTVKPHATRTSTQPAQLNAKAQADHKRTSGTGGTKTLGENSALGLPIPGRPRRCA